VRERLEAYDLVVFDADDTLRYTVIPGQPCPRRSGEWALLPGVAETLRPIAWMRLGGPLLGLASNQDQVGYGHLSEATARRLLGDLSLAATGTVPPAPAIQLCPHRLDIPCACRKPAPGMLRQIMGYYGVAPERTLFVGNTASDRGAADAARTRYADAREIFRRSA